MIKLNKHITDKLSKEGLISSNDGWENDIKPPFTKKKHISKYGESIIVLISKEEMPYKEKQCFYFTYFKLGKGRERDERGGKVRRKKKVGRG